MKITYLGNSHSAFEARCDDLIYQWVVDFAQHKNWGIALSQKDIVNIEKSRRVVEKCCASNKPVYGINTGVGAFANKIINKKDLAKLQYNIIKSHAVAVGDPLSKDISKAVLFLLINSLSKGFSGVRLKLVNFLINLFNKDIIPVIPSQGSLGASGDLASLAHLALVVVGEGQVWRDGKICGTKTFFEEEKIEPLQLEAKEGLSLVNGTHVMAAVACFNLYYAEILIESADIIGAMSLEAYKGSIKPFDEIITRMKPHKGQRETSEMVSEIVRGSGIIASHKNCDKVQDPYSFRCIPQVHGDCRDIFNHAVEAVNIEINSITDNPIVYGEKIISGGNFHGQRLASVMRCLAGPFINLSAISERRINNLLDGSRDHLSKFLVKKEGLNSGLMILQYVAVALIGDSKTRCPTIYSENIPVSANQEDFVSGGMAACQRVSEICENTVKVLAIELICAAQALEFIKEKPAIAIYTILVLARTYINFIRDDCEMDMSRGIKNIADIIKNKRLLEIVGKE